MKSTIFQWIGLYTVVFPIFVTGSIIASCFIVDLWDSGKRKTAVLIFAYIVVLCLLTACGCSWQGQRHIEYAVQAKDIIWPADMPLCVKPEAWVKLRKAEWWSMRLLWVSNGVESYTRTDFWETGFRAAESKSDPNAVDVMEKTLDLAHKVIP